MPSPSPARGNDVKAPRAAFYVIKGNTMRRHRRQFSIWGGVVAVKTMPYIAGAQSYPALPIAIIVPYAAGGPSDVIARMHGQRMRGIIGPPVLKENIVGAGGSISLGPRRPRSARRLYRRPRELGARACQLDFDLLRSFLTIHC
jgi:hypothetical protein